MEKKCGKKVMKKIEKEGEKEGGGDDVRKLAKRNGTKKGENCGKIEEKGGKVEKKGEKVEKKVEKIKKKGEIGGNVDKMRLPRKGVQESKVSVKKCEKGGNKGEKMGIIKKSEKVGIIKKSKKVGIIKKSEKMGIIKKSEKMGNIKKSGKMGIIKKIKSCDTIEIGEKRGEKKKAQKRGKDEFEDFDSFLDGILEDNKRRKIDEENVSEQNINEQNINQKIDQKAVQISHPISKSEPQLASHELTLLDSVINSLSKEGHEKSQETVDLKTSLKALQKGPDVLESLGGETSKKRANRTVLYKTANDHMTHYMPQIVRNLDSEQVTFGFHSKRQSPSINTVVSEFKGQGNFEKEIEMALEGLEELPEESDKIQQIRDPQIVNHLNRDRIGKLKSLLFREQMRARRVNKIKSKTWHRLQKKQDTKEKERLLVRLDAENPELALKMRDEFETMRAAERIQRQGAARKKWAKNAARFGGREINKLIAQTHQAAHDQKVAISKIAKSQIGKQFKSGESDDDSTDHSDEEPTTEEGVKKRVEAKRQMEAIRELKNNGEDLPTTGLMGMTFMRSAVEAQREESKKTLQKIVDESEEGSSGEEEDETRGPLSVMERAGVTQAAVERARASRENGKGAELIGKLRAELSENSAPSNSEGDRLTQTLEQTRNKKGILKWVENAGDTNQEKIAKNNQNHDDHFMYQRNSITDDIHTPLEMQNVIMPNTTVNSEKTTENPPKHQTNIEKIPEKNRKNPTNSPQNQDNIEINAKNNQQNQINPWLTPTPQNTANISQPNQFSLDALCEEFKLENHEEQTELIRQTFVTGTQENDFFEMKDKQEEEARAPDDPDAVPGWGAWTGVGVKNKKPKPKPTPKKKVESAHKKKPIVLSAEPDRRIARYQVSELPFGYSDKEQYELTLRHPAGRDWNTAAAHNRFIQPKVNLRIGAIVPPLMMAKSLPAEAQDSLLKAWDSKNNRMPSKARF